MIAIGGPPLGGKGVLAARLADCFPRVVKLELSDDLISSSGNGHAPATLSALLGRAKQVWRDSPAARRPTILVVARFATPTRRRRARAAARAERMRFLFVEARSSEEAVLRRLARPLLSRRELEERVRRYAAALRSYRAVNAAERLYLPALSLARVQSRLDQASERVIEAWRPR